MRDQPARRPLAAGSLKFELRVRRLDLTHQIPASDFQDPNAPANTLDDNPGTRWSAQGDGQWIRYDLGMVKTVHSLELAWHNGASRVSKCLTTE